MNIKHIQEQIDKFIQEDHPLTYIPKVIEILSKETHTEHPQECAQLFNDIYDDIYETEDLFETDIAPFYRHIMNITNFEFSFNTPYNLFITHVIQKSDSCEYKEKLIDKLKTSPTDIVLIIKRWPHNNFLTIEDSAIVKKYYSHYIELINNHPAKYNEDIDYILGGITINEQNINNYANQQVGICNTLTQCCTVEHDKTKLYCNTLTLLAHPYAYHAYSDVLYWIGKQLLGDRFKTIYKTAQLLEQTANVNFWEAHTFAAQPHTITNDNLNIELI